MSRYNRYLLHCQEGTLGMNREGREIGIEGEGEWSDNYDDDGDS